MKKFLLGIIGSVIAIGAALGCSGTATEPVYHSNGTHVTAYMIQVESLPHFRTNPKGSVAVTVNANGEITCRSGYSVATGRDGELICVPDGET